ncbi:MAG: GYD domain-containing protein [Nitrospiraceae bacterium]|nr:GYD domain-containing protein [Nitrospiraceae bacterium]
MAHYMVQFKYGTDNIKGLVQKPENRTTLIRESLGSFNGKLHSFFYAYGEYDGVLIAEFPDSESCTAFLLMVASKGGVAAFNTTVLIDPEEATRSMRRAGETKTNYRPAAT